jgi:hypothetical protein
MRTIRQPGHWYRNQQSHLSPRKEKKNPDLKLILGKSKKEKKRKHLLMKMKGAKLPRKQ